MIRSVTLQILEYMVSKIFLDVGSSLSLHRPPARVSLCMVDFLRVIVLFAYIENLHKLFKDVLGNVRCDLWFTANMKHF